MSADPPGQPALGALVAGVSWLAAAEALRLAAGAAIAIYLARRIGTAAFGLWTVAIAMTGYPLALVEAGLTWIGTREIARNRSAVPPLVRTIVPIRLALAAAGIAAVAIVALSLDRPALDTQVLLMATASLVTTALTLDWVFYGLEQPSTVAAASVTRTTIFGAATLLLIRAPEQVWMVPLLQASGELVAAWQLWSAYSRRVDRHAAPGVIALRPLVRQSAPLAVAQLMRAVSAWSGVTVVALVSTASAAGAFGAAQRLSQLAAGFTALYFYGYLPHMSRAVSESPAAVRALVGRSLRLASLFTVPLALAMTLVARPLTLAIFGPGYEAAVPVLRILVWTVPVAVIGGHFRHALIASRLTRLDLGSVSAGAITTLALNAALVRQFGLRGAAAAAVAGEIVVAIAAAHLALRRVMVR